MHPLLAALFLVAVLSPEPLTNELPTPPAHFEQAWETHHPDFIPAMLIRPAIIQAPADDAYRGMGSGAVEEWRPLVAGQFPPEQVDNALCVINSESGGNPSAKNPRSNARGLFQVMSSVWGDYFGFTHEDFYTPELNVYAAARIWERSGWSPWSPRTRRNCGL